MNLGIGITTRNRPDVLAMALRHHAKYSPQDAMIVIVDDSSSDPGLNLAAWDEFRPYHPLTQYRYSEKRLGIAGAKNYCLHLLQDCEQVFLLDDDAWPSQADWPSLWLLPVLAHGVGHSLWNMQFSHMIRTECIGSGLTQLDVWNHCCGLALHFTRACLNALGGFDPRAGLYGYEHAQMSVRAALAGFCRGHSYVSPARCADLIYSLDVHYGWLGQQPPLGQWQTILRSACTQEEAAAHENYAFLMRDTPIFIPLEGPK